MKEAKSDKPSLWQKASYSNLIRYVPSGIYFARIRVGGKLIRKTLKTDVISVAKLRLSDLEREERAKVEANIARNSGKILFHEAQCIYQERLQGDGSLKPRTKQYYEERIIALRKSWPDLPKLDLRKISQTDCLNWAARFSPKSSPIAFNHTVRVLRNIIQIGIEKGAIYNNPAQSIKWVKERPKILRLPESHQFAELIKEIENAGSGFSTRCADLVRFLAYGGFRKTEAANVTWNDCNFAKGEITVRGDSITGTKNSEIRRVPMIPEMRRLLKGLRADRSNETQEQPVMQVRECQGALETACAKTKIARITHHDLRHLFATRCIESGVDIPTVSRWLGHKDGGALAMRVYGHLRDQHSTAMAQKVSFAVPNAKKLIKKKKEAAKI